MEGLTCFYNVSEAGKVFRGLDFKKRQEIVDIAELFCTSVYAIADKLINMTKDNQLKDYIEIFNCK